MKNAVILHGTDATPQDHWFNWLKQELEARNYRVWLPQLPDADRPNMQKYTQFLKGNDFKFNEETILIGHSSGAVAILGLLQSLPVGSKIKAAFFVGAFENDLGWNGLKELFIRPLDFKNIKQKADKFIFIHSDNDPYCPLEQAQHLSEKLGGELFIQKGQGHFNTDSNPKFSKFPYLIQLINEKIGAGNT